jgi:hypothetical protein
MEASLVGLFNVFAHWQRRWSPRRQTVIAQREPIRRCWFESMEQRHMLNATPVTLGAANLSADALHPPGDSSIAGIVHIDLVRNNQVDPGEAGLGGVAIQLLHPSGDVLATTVTDANGHYRFDDLAPGTYAIRELAPSGLFHGGQALGSGDGEATTDLLFNIHLEPGQQLVGYNFGELPPSVLSGYVFRDGPTLFTPDGRPPLDLQVIRDGRLTTEDVGLAGVVLELRNALTGEAIRGEETIPGTYPPGPIRAVTNADGFYEFRGLPAGNYAVVQVQPSGYVDGLDTPGSSGGLAINPQANLSPMLLQPFTMAGVNLSDDAILRIPLGYGEVSTNNNFSEVAVDTLPTIIYPLAPTPTPRPPREVLPFVYATAGIDAPPLNNLLRVDSYVPYAGGGDYSWHLSVVDIGAPRGLSLMQRAKSFDAAKWHADKLQMGQWTLPTASDEVRARWSSSVPQFGILGATPLVGDFNGDGVDELAMYLDGEWFIDINGNGRWDENDLWFQLGTRTDRPVVGDWDGDGRDDIGVFGPQWERDHLALRDEAGLPDAENPASRATQPAKQVVPPQVEQVSTEVPHLPPSQRGAGRGHAIDHVFQLGAENDIPLAGDFNGDGIDSIGVYHGGLWRLDVNGDGKLTTHDRTVKFGEKDDIPIVGDFDGDGIDEIGIYRDGKWIIDSNHNGAIDAADQVFELGGEGDLPIVGDFNGDGIDEPGTYRSR